MLTKLRVLGNALALIGYFVLLYIDPQIGSALKLMGAAMVIPFCAKIKVWDVVFMLGFFGAMDLVNVIRHF